MQKRPRRSSWTRDESEEFRVERVSNLSLGFCKGIYRGEEPVVSQRAIEILGMRSTGSQSLDNGHEAIESCAANPKN